MFGFSSFGIFRTAETRHSSWPLFPADGGLHHFAFVPIAAEGFYSTGDCPWPGKRDGLKLGIFHWRGWTPLNQKYCCAILIWGSPLVPGSFPVRRRCSYSCSCSLVVIVVAAAAAVVVVVVVVLVLVVVVVVVPWRQPRYEETQHSEANTIYGFDALQAPGAPTVEGGRKTHSQETFCMKVPRFVKMC